MRTVRHRSRLAAALCILVLACKAAAGGAKRSQAAAEPMPAATTPATPDPLTAAEAVRAGLVPTSATRDLARAARAYGSIVDAARSASLSDDALRKLVQITNALGELAAGKLSAIEDAAGDDEAALEQLYRSAAFDDLSFAMAAFPYWRSWLELTLAERSPPSDARIAELARARRGFRVAALQIFQPGLVYGGWLGLGLVALAEDERARAVSIFEKLETALASEPDHPVEIAAAAQLQRLREQAASAPLAAPAGTNDSDAGRLRAEAFALLERQRKTQAGGREGGAKLRALIDAGLMEETLLEDMLRYAPEVVREDLGIWGELVGAEYAFTNAQYYTAVEKYQKFFAQAPHVPGLDFDRFRYRHAVACLKSDLTDQAAQIGERLLRDPKLSPELRTASLKLVYVARARREAAHGTPESRRALQQAARRFLEASPADPQADGARLVLAQSSDDPAIALALLDTVKKPETLAGEMATTRFLLVARRFERGAPGADAPSAAIARQGMNAFEALPAAEKRVPERYAAYLQMRATADPRPEDVVQAIDLAEQQGGLDPAARKALLWARLRCYERLGQPERLVSYLRQPGATSLAGWQLEIVYPWVKALPEGELKRRMCAAVEPLLGDLPDMDRRFRALEIDALIAAQRADEAYAAATAFNARYPKAGDGWVRLARAARLTHRFGEAESAWAIVTDRTDPEAAAWQEGMLARIEMKAESTAPTAACPLVADVKAHPPRASAEFLAKIAIVENQIGCRTATPPSSSTP